MRAILSNIKNAIIEYRKDYYARFDVNDIFLQKKTIVLAKVNIVFMVLFLIFILPLHFENFYLRPMLPIGDIFIIIGMIFSLLEIHLGKYSRATMLTIITLFGGIFIHNVIGDAIDNNQLTDIRFFETLIDICFLMPIILGFTFKKYHVFFAIAIAMIFIIGHLFVLISYAHVDINKGYIVYLVIAIIPGVVGIANLSIVDEAIASLIESNNSISQLNKMLEKKVEQRTVELQKLNDKLKEMSKIDGLTKIANRRYLDEHIIEEWNRSSRNGTPLSVLLLDIDEFKKYNDYYGHQVGDLCLINIAEVLKHHTKRSGELAARYGGEEFAVILPELNPDDVIVAAEMIRKDIESVEIAHAPNSQHRYVTVSIGVGILHGKEHLPKEATICPDIITLLKAADKELYKAKDLGRNRICTTFLYREKYKTKNKLKNS